MLSVGHVAACGLESDWSKVPHCRESRVVMVEQGLGRRVAVVLRSNIEAEGVFHESWRGTSTRTGTRTRREVC